MCTRTDWDPLRRFVGNHSHFETVPAVAYRQDKSTSTRFERLTVCGHRQCYCSIKLNLFRCQYFFFYFNVHQWCYSHLFRALLEWVKPYTAWHECGIHFVLARFISSRLFDYRQSFIQNRDRQVRGTRHDVHVVLINRWWYPEHLVTSFHRFFFLPMAIGGNKRALRSVHEEDLRASPETP